LLTVLLCIPVHAQAEIAVQPENLPGGVTVVSSDPGDTGLMGRASGLDYTFSNIDLPRFLYLMWGPPDDQAVGLAFDGEITTGTSEVLAYDSLSSNLSSGIAVWAGSADVQTIYGMLTLQTRYIMTVTDGNGSPASLTLVNGLPRLDVLAVNGNFSVNMKLEALSGTWRGALDVYDALETVGDGLTRMSVWDAFFIDSSMGMSIDEHDANMNNRADEILGAIDFLQGETQGRMDNLSNTTNDIHNLLFDVQNRMFDIAQRSDVERLKDNFNELIQILIQLWGIHMNPDGTPDPSTITLISSLARESTVQDLRSEVQNVRSNIDDLSAQISGLDTKMNLIGSSVKLEVISSERASHRDKRFIILSSVDGLEVDAQITGVEIIREKRRQGFTVDPASFTAEIIATGLTDLQIDLPQHGHSAKIFRIFAEYTTPDGVRLFGTALISKDDD